MDRMPRREATVTIALSIADGRIIVEHRCFVGRETYGQDATFAKLEEAAAHVRRLVLTDCRDAIRVNPAARKAAVRAYTSWRPTAGRTLAHA